MIKNRNIRNLAALTNSVSNVRQVLQLPLDRVVSKPQVRVQFRNLNELAESLKEEGQQSPIIVSPKNSVGQYVIEKGERRWRAAKLAGLERIDVIVNNKEQSPTELLAGQLVENIQRDDLTAIEISDAIQKLHEAGWTKSKIAQKLGKRSSYVTLYSSIHALPNDIKALHNDGYITDATSLTLLGRIYDLDQEKAHSIFKEIQEQERMSREQIRQYLAELTPSTDEEVFAEDDFAEGVKDEQTEKEPTEHTSGFNENLHEEHLGHTKNDIHATSSYEAEESPTIEQPSTSLSSETDYEQSHEEPYHEPSPIIESYDEQTEQTEQDEKAINAGARTVSSNNLLIEVLVSDGQDDHIAQLMLNVVSENSDMAWVLIDGTPTEVKVTAISILEIRDKAYEQ